MPTQIGDRLRFGPTILPPVTEVERQSTVVVSFVTTPAAAAHLLPPCFEPAERPVLSVTYQQLDNVDYMRGRGYNLVNVAVTAVLETAGGPLTRSCPVVIWENNTMPIIAGRELHGNPKIYGDVSGLTRDGDTAAWDCREYGTLLLRGEIGELRPLPADRLARVNRASVDSEIFGWKSIPGRDAPDADYPTLIHGSTSFEQGWSGVGRVEFATPTDDQAPYSAVVLRALAAVPQVEPRPAFVGVGSAKLFRNRTERLA